MEITFEGHVPQARTIEPGPVDLLNFKDEVKSLALAAFEYQDWNGPYYTVTQRPFVELCEKFGVDYTYKKDRVAFAAALIELL